MVASVQSGTGLKQLNTRMNSTQRGIELAKTLQGVSRTDALFCAREVRGAMTTPEVERYLHEHIPLSAAMGGR